MLGRYIGKSNLLCYGQGRRSLLESDTEMEYEALIGGNQAEVNGQGCSWHVELKVNDTGV